MVLHAKLESREGLMEHAMHVKHPEVVTLNVNIFLSKTDSKTGGCV
jgi:hypothetical protein